MKSNFYDSLPSTSIQKSLLTVSPETSSEDLIIAFKIASFHQLKKEMTLEEVEETLTRLQSKPGVLGTLLVTGFHSQTFWTRVARSVHE